MSIKKTAIYDKHVAMNALMVEFKNTLLPVRFSSEIEEHQAVRKSAGIFDVSHMGEFFFEGAHAREFLQNMLTNNVDNLAVGQAQYSLMLNDNGGIIDDLIVYRLETDRYLLCVNAGNIAADWQQVSDAAKRFTPCEMRNASTAYSQFAVQGPMSEKILAKLCDEALPPKFAVRSLKLSGINTIVARTGYTGEDGFEIFMANDEALSLYENLLSAGTQFGLTPCGLAARDSLRLEAGLMLHGQDMNDHTSPKDVGLMFAVDMNKDNFIGKQALLEHVPTHKMVGFKLIDKGLARHDFAVFNEDQKTIGTVTSATYLADKKLAIGCALIEKPFSKIGQHIYVDIRNRHARAEVCSLRFLHH